MKVTVVLLGMILVLAASGCARSPAGDEGQTRFERNTEFAGPKLRVFLTLKDGRRVSVNTADDAVESRSAATPIPGHQARDWTFIKDVEEGTSIAHALVSWDGDDPADYLMAGWWAEFPNQHFPDLSMEWTPPFPRRHDAPRGHARGVRSGDKGSVRGQR